MARSMDPMRHDFIHLNGTTLRRDERDLAPVRAMRSVRRQVTIACALSDARRSALGSCGGGGAEAAPTAPTPAEGAAPWPRPADPLERTREAGLDLATVEFLDYHVHAHLDVFVNGQLVDVPAAIGIDIEDPAVKELDSETGPGWGGIPEEGCVDPRISPLHTHFSDGGLHTEAASDRPSTLGEFFTEWGVVLDASCVGGYCTPDAVIQVFVDGDLFEGNPAEVELVDQREIAIVIGSSPESVPSDYFSNA